jgi:hypothetical protein
MKRSRFALVVAVAATAVFSRTLPIRAAEEQPFYAAESTTAWVGEDGPFQVWMGTGTGTHVGQYMTLTYVKVKGYSGQAEGTTTITAADGDVLYIEHEATWDYDTACWIGTYQIVGGEGRFEGATGSGEILVCAPDYNEVLVGTISY